MAARGDRSQKLRRGSLRQNLRFLGTYGAHANVRKCTKTKQVYQEIEATFSKYVLNTLIWHECTYASKSNRVKVFIIIIIYVRMYIYYCIPIDDKK